MGLDKDRIDKIMMENGNDINKEKEKTNEKEEKCQLLQEKLEEANETIASYKDMDLDDGEGCRGLESKV